MTTPAEDFSAIDIFAFLCEIAMLVLLVLAGHGLVDGWAGWVLGVVLAVVAIGIWGRWTAPTAANRLRNPRRLIAQTVVFVVAGLLVSLAGWPVWGVGFTVVATATFASRRADRSN